VKTEKKESSVHMNTRSANDREQTVVAMIYKWA